MTAGQLEELLGKVTQGEWALDGICISGPNYAAGDVCYMGEPAQWSGDTSRMITNWENNATLIAIAPSLALRVIAAEKLVDDAERVMHELLVTDSWSNYEVNKLLAAITAYREASK